MAKLVSNLQFVRNGVVATASYDRLYTALMADGVSMYQNMVYRKELLSPMYKNASAIYEKILKSVQADDKTELYIDILAQNFINAICEENKSIS